jgi:hypothetical protein
VQVLSALQRDPHSFEKIDAAGWEFVSELFSSSAPLSFIGVGMRAKKPAAAKAALLQ